jgi:tetratricopeptide (TPR) repeat protein
MNSDKHIQLYLEGSLKGPELELFTKRLKEDDAFRALYLDYQKAWILIEKQHRKLNMMSLIKERIRMSRNAISIEDIRQEVGMFIHENAIDASEEERFKEVLTAYFIKRYRNNKRIGFALAMAAGILLLLGIPLTVFMNREFKNSSQLFDQYYSAYPYFLSERSVRIENSTLNSKAMYLYNNHDYPAAALILQEPIPDSLAYPLQSLYLGICYMEMKKYNDAVKTFEAIISMHHQLTFCQANWYLGLTYLKMNKRSKAKECFLKVRSDSCLFTKQANEVLNKIKQN